MTAEGGWLDFMFLAPPYPAAGSATVMCLIHNTIETEALKIGLICVQI